MPSVRIGDVALRLPAGHSPTEFPQPEAMAATFADPPTREEILSLVPPLESEVPGRGAAGPASLSFTVGAWSKSGTTGIRLRTHAFPNVTRALVQFVRAQAPTHTFAAVAIFRNLQTDLHIDVNNEHASHNLLLPLSQFSGGSVWQEQSGGAVPFQTHTGTLWGESLDVASGPQLLDPLCRHATLAWEGDRILLVAYSPAGCGVLSSLSMQLRSFGFPLWPVASVLPSELSLAGIQVPLPAATLSPVDFTCAPEEALCVEIFCGQARLSAACRELGMSILPIDKVRKSAAVQVVALDLTDPQDQLAFFELLSTANVCVAHFAPVCGTASRARERPAPPGLQFAARPLRSSAHPLGRPGLSGAQAARVESANVLYAVTLAAMWLLCLRGALVSCENPTHSLFWRVADIMAQDLPDPMAWFALVDNVFDSCMYGGERRKATTFRASPGLCDVLRARCDSTHTHASWEPYNGPSGVVFPSAQEAAYPRLLAQAFAAEAHAALLQLGVQFEASSIGEGVKAPRHLREFAKRPLPPLLAEYWLVCPPQCVPPGAVCKPLPPHVVFPKRGDVVKTVNSKEEVVALLPFAEEPGTVVALLGGNATGKEPLVGVYRTPSQTVKATAMLQHPLQLALPLPDNMVEAVLRVLSLGPSGLVDLRLNVLRTLQSRRRDLQPDENKLHAGMHPDLARVLEGKSTLLWEQLLAETQFPDPGLIAEVRQGFELVGPATPSGAFPKGVKPAQQTTQQLKSQCVWRRKATVARCGPTGDGRSDHELWKQTLEEVDQGWIAGPFEDEPSVSKHLGTSEWFCTRRFPILQGEKVRIIDDCLQSGLNSAYAAFNKLKLMGADHFISLVLLLIRAAATPGSQVKLASGKVLEVVRHPGWGTGLGLLGKTLDLASAYKQLGCRPETAFNRVLVAWDPVRERPAYFVGTALMFGATASVFSFNRCSASLHHLAVTLGAICCPVYFDDFPCVEPSLTAGSSEAFLVGLLEVLGWRVALQPKKNAPFSRVFDMLGVRVNLGRADKGLVEVRNKPERSEALKAEVSRLLEQGFIRRSEASALHGRLNFAQGQLHGCPFKPAMAFLSRVSVEGWKEDMCTDMALSLAYVAACLECEVPRLVKAVDERPPARVFTDGSWEGQDGGSGAVLFLGPSDMGSVAEVLVPPDLTHLWREQGRSQLVSQYELFPILAVLQRWGAKLAGRKVIFFIDNNGVRDSLIKGSTNVPHSFAMLAIIASMLRALDITPWFTRVASKSNPSDGPSRHQAAETARELGATLERPLVVDDWVVGALLSSHSFLGIMGRSVGKEGDLGTGT